MWTGRVVMVMVVVVVDAGCWKIVSGRGVIVANFNFFGRKNKRGEKMDLACVNVVGRTYL